MFRCKVYAAEMRMSHGAMRAKRLWLESKISSVYSETGEIPPVGFILENGCHVEEVRSTPNCILLIIKRKKKNDREQTLCKEV